MNACMHACLSLSLNMKKVVDGCKLSAFFCCQDPKIYVNTILEVHKKYNALVLTAFSNDSGFVAALDKACGRFINSNAVTRQANSSSKSPELLAKYCDLLLKKSSKNPEEAELEDTLNQVVSTDLEIGVHA